MATTTTNNGWPIPQSTDLVKDGATAIASLGSAIDSTLGVYTGGSGLTLINTTTATGAVSSVSVNNVFSSTYKNYLITISPNGAVTGAGIVLNFKLRASGTDNSSGYGYVTKANYFSDGTVGTIGNSSSTTSIGLGYMTATNNQIAMALNVFNPYVAVRSSIWGTGIGANSGDSTYCLTEVGGAHSDNGLFDGFSLIRSSSTGLELTIKTYGVKN